MPLFGVVNVPLSLNEWLKFQNSTSFSLKSWAIVLKNERKNNKNVMSFNISVGDVSGDTNIGLGDVFEDANIGDTNIGDENNVGSENIFI